MGSESLQKKLDRVRKPRVHITYDVETEGAAVTKELPFVVGVLGDFSGQPTEPLKPLKDRKFIQIDRDNFNDVMARMTPGLNLRVKNALKDDGSGPRRAARVWEHRRLLPEEGGPADRAGQEVAGDSRQAPRPAHQDRPLRGPEKVLGTGVEHRTS